MKFVPFHQLLSVCLTAIWIAEVEMPAGLAGPPVVSTAVPEIADQLML